MPRETDPRLVAVAYNVWSGQPPRQLRANLHRLIADVADQFGEKPHVIAMQEAHRFDGTIRGYTRISHDEGHPDNSNGVLLVRTRGVTLGRRREVVGGGEPWLVVSHDRRHPPRVWPGVSAEADGRRWDVLDVHRVPSRRVNAAAWKAEHEALLDWCDRRAEHAPGRPLVMLGDWNDHADSDDDWSVSALATDVDGDLLLKGIDGAIVRGCTGRAHRLDDKYGSDHHHPIVLTLSATKETP